jgi:glycosyltransferase involved in cell wall biosynthesis
MEKEVPGMTGKSRINLMALIVSMPVGGVETQLLSILQRLNKERYNVILCCIRDLGILGGKAAEIGIKAIALDLMKSSRFSPGIACRISGIIKENNVHVLWTHQYAANFYGRMASFFVNIPVTIPTFHVLYDNPKLHRSILNHLLSYKTDIMVSVSDAVADDMVKFDKVNRGEIKTIYNGIDEKIFDSSLSKQEARKILDLPSDNIIIGTVGNLREQKGHRFLIKAASGLKNVCVAIAGEGELKDELRHLAGQCCVNCIFTGQMDPEKIPVFLRALDIFCFPSLWEGFGIAIAEAMASGLPIIASDISPHREVLGATGVFFPPGNAEKLAGALKELTEDTSLREALAKKAKERASMFSIDKTVKAYEDLIEATLKKKRFYETV